MYHFKPDGSHTLSFRDIEEIESKLKADPSVSALTMGDLREFPNHRGGVTEVS